MKRKVSSRQIRTLSRFLFLASMAGLCGCRTTEPGFARIINEPLPLTAEVRSNFGVIAVVPIDVPAHMSFKAPASPLEIGGKVGSSTFIALQSSRTYEGAHMNHKGRWDWDGPEGEPDIENQLRWLPFDLLFSAATGVVAGLFAGVPEHDIKHAGKTFNKVVKAEPLAPGIQICLARLANARHFTNLLAIHESELTAFQNTTNTGYSALSESGIDSLMFLSVANQRFASRKGSNPPMSVAAGLNVQIVRVSDGSILHSSYLEYRGERHPLLQWSASEGHLFRKELQLAQQTFAEIIFETILVGD